MGVVWASSKAAEVGWRGCRSGRSGARTRLVALSLRVRDGDSI